MNRFIFLAIVLIALTLVGCTPSKELKPTELTLAAASSLKTIFDRELIPLFEKQYPHIKLITTYDGSGKLQTQIEEGASVDVFLPASTKQMNALHQKGLLIKESIQPLVENKLVMIVPKSAYSDSLSFEVLVDIGTVAIGDPQSVPAGQYAKELLIHLDLWDTLESSLSYGTNVTEVLNWVAEGSAHAGFVFSTDARSSAKVDIVATASSDQVSQIIYPIGIIHSSRHKEESQLLINFLASDEVKAIFESYGFSKIR